MSYYRLGAYQPRSFAGYARHPDDLVDAARAAEESVPMVCIELGPAEGREWNLYCGPHDEPFLRTSNARVRTSLEGVARRNPVVAEAWRDTIENWFAANKRRLASTDPIDVRLVKSLRGAAEILRRAAQGRAA